MTVTNKQINDSIEQGITDAISQGIRDWMGATNALIDLLVDHNECFSSGEIAAHLRTFMPNLRFSVTSNIGNHLRDRFYGNTLPLYENDDGTHTAVEMVPRTTQGFTRTPVGTEVFVYGPDYTSCMDHEFEVDIPSPGTQVPADPNDSNGLPARPVQAPTPKQPGGKNVVLRPRKPVMNLTATVHADGRCCVPRSAIEALLHETGASLKGGDPMYVTVTDDLATIGLDNTPGSNSYSIWASTGRVYFPRPANPFVPGTAFRIRVNGSDRCLTVDLSKAV